MPPAASPELLRAFRLFGGLPDGLLADLALRAHARALAGGERLWRAGEAATHFTLVQTGLVKIVRRQPDGTEAIVGLFGPRESIGDAAVIGTRGYPADAVAASPAVRVLRVEAAGVLAAARTLPEAAAALNRALLDHTQALQDKIAVMSAGSVEQRLATLLLVLAERFGDEADDGATSIPLPLSRGELSRLVSATTETVIRALSRWRGAGLVATDARGFRVRSLEELRAITRGDA